MALSSDLFDFLKNLKENNNRPWFKGNKVIYDALKDEVNVFSHQVFHKLNKSNQLSDVKVFRIYRDIRFSKDKTPYKTHFGIGFHRIKPRYRGGYYLHIEPGNSFVAVGFWKPNREDLYRVRKEIEMDHKYFRNIVSHGELVNVWGKMKGERLKIAPKGFDKLHKAVDLFQYKQYLFVKKISDQQVLSDSFIKEISTCFKVALPFVNYMSDILTTDLNGESLID